MIPFNQYPTSDEVEILSGLHPIGLNEASPWCHSIPENLEYCQKCGRNGKWPLVIRKGKEYFCFYHGKLRQIKTTQADVAE